jgi:hypothetical protein
MKKKTCEPPFHPPVRTRPNVAGRGEQNDYCFWNLGEEEDGEVQQHFPARTTGKHATPLPGILPSERQPNPEHSQ